MLKTKVILSGYSGFPFQKSASNEKQKLLAKSILLNNNYDVLISNYISFSNFKYNKKGIFEGIPYRLFCLFSKKTNYSLLNLINRYFGLLNEYLFLLSRKYDYLIVSDRNVFYLIALILITKIKRKKIVITLVEDFSKSNRSFSFLYKVKNFLFYNYVLRYIDGAMPISKTLSNLVKLSNNNLPQLRVPIFTDFDQFDSFKSSNKSDYFLYCGSAGYFNAIEYIVNEFNYVSSSSFLTLIVNGSYLELEKVHNLVRHKKYLNKIRIKSNISYDSLIKLYKGSIALLIPLEFTLQEKSRFPHKIAEYCASRRPIVSTEFGEVANFFVDKENAFLMKKNGSGELGEILKFILNNKDTLENVAKNSFELGFKLFNYKNYSTPINLFLKKL